MKSQQFLRSSFIASRRQSICHTARWRNKALPPTAATSTIALNVSGRPVARREVTNTRAVRGFHFIRFRLEWTGRPRAVDRRWDEKPNDAPPYQTVATLTTVDDTNWSPSARTSGRRIGIAQPQWSEQSRVIRRKFPRKLPQQELLPASAFAAAATGAVFVRIIPSPRRFTATCSRGVISCRLASSYDCSLRSSHSAGFLHRRRRRQ